MLRRRLPSLPVTTTQLMRRGARSMLPANCNIEAFRQQTTRVSPVVAIAKGCANRVMQAIAGSLLS
jgi:hypothetical protein